MRRIVWLFKKAGNALSAALGQLLKGLLLPIKIRATA